MCEKWHFLSGWRMSHVVTPLQLGKVQYWLLFSPNLHELYGNKLCPVRNLEYFTMTEPLISTNQKTETTAVRFRILFYIQMRRVLKGIPIHYPQCSWIDGVKGLHRNKVGSDPRERGCRRSHPTSHRAHYQRIYLYICEPIEGSYF